MKIKIQILTCFLLASCNSQLHKINDVSDIEKLAGALNIELQMEKIEPICSEIGLQQVEKFLESKSEHEQTEYILKVGSYLGECIIKSYGGEWVEHEPGIWGIKLSENNLVFPIGKVRKFVNDPTGESFSSMYEIIPVVFELNKKP